MTKLPFSIGILSWKGYDSLLNSLITYEKNGLSKLTNNKKFDRTTKMSMSYSLLKSSSKMKMFKPCLKHYLSSNINSRLLLIEPADWEIAIFLPTESFRKVGKTTVWNESRKQF